MEDQVVGIILAGGQGSRIRSLYPDMPKPLIPVSGEPFIEWVLRHASSQGIRQFVISLGHLAEVAERYFRSRPADHLTIRTVREDVPLGTGGGFWRAQEQAAPDADVLAAMNGDSLILADFSAAWKILADPRVDGVVLATEVDDARRYGRIEANSAGRLLRLREKQAGGGLVNAGVYFFRRRVLEKFPRRRPLSMELDVFPRLLADGAEFAVAVCQAPFIDIGTPESAGQAGPFIDRNFKGVTPL